MEISITIPLRDFREIKKALEEAMGWNWLDDNMPKYVVKQCEEALKKMEI